MRIINPVTPVAYIGTVALCSFLCGNDVLMEIMSGGLMLGAFFMATDYATCPMTSSGKLIYGVGCGAITVFIRFFAGFNEGVSFAILIMNLLVWYIDKLTRPRPFGKIKSKKGEKSK